jgi:hypothetical protein
MTHGSVGNHRAALDDLDCDVHVPVGQQHADSLAEHTSIATDGDEMTIISDADGDVARETQKTFSTRCDRDASMTTPAEHRHLRGNSGRSDDRAADAGVDGKEGTGTAYGGLVRFRPQFEADVVRCVRGGFPKA